MFVFYAYVYISNNVFPYLIIQKQAKQLAESGKTVPLSDDSQEIA